MNRIIYIPNEEGYLVRKCKIIKGKYVGSVWCVEECKHFKKKSSQNNIVFCGAEIKRGKK
jgi:hypothetical protein